MPASCHALFISAPASGQGKTTVTAALARMYVQRGLRVRVFKTGPDFLDPMILAVASGAPVYQLDLWMCGEEHCKALLFEAAQNADVILVEGVMGLFDGEPSGADLATRFNIPVMTVIDASAMAQTFAALAFGLANFQAGLPFAGVLANRVGSAGHAQMLKESLPADMTWFGALERDAEFELPSRHLGLFQASEVADLDQRINKAASALANMFFEQESISLPPVVTFDPVDEAAAQIVQSKPLTGKRIAIAQDAAFAFIYRANLDVLRALGAELIFFSPLTDAELPDAHSLYLPGGYPELHLDELVANQRLKQSIRKHHAENKPIVAECGGMLYLLESLTDHEGRAAEMIGLLQGEAKMLSRLANLGLHEINLPEGVVRGHTYHHSQTQSEEPVFAHTEGRRGKPEPVYRKGRLHASYLHLYFPSNVAVTASLFA